VRKNDTCDLCGLPIGAVPYTLRTVTEQTRQFCCDGCKGIYQMLHEDQVVDDDGTAEPG
jgi:hypothetical protein